MFKIILFLLLSLNIFAENFRVHYQRGDKDYENWSVWIWHDVASPTSEWPKGVKFTGVDEFGAYVDIPLKAEASKVGFLFVNPTTGEKDGNDKVFAALDKQKEVYTFQGSDDVFLTPVKVDIIAVADAKISDKNQIEVILNKNEYLQKVTADEFKIFEGITVNDITNFEVKEDRIILTTKNSLEKGNFELTYKKDSKALKYSQNYIDKKFATDEKLGVTYKRWFFFWNRTTFKLWAPLASTVVVDIYDKDDSNKLVKTYSLNEKNGLWDLTVKDMNLDGYFYQYRVRNKGESEKKVLDPYAISMAESKIDTTGKPLDGDGVGKGAILNPRKIKKVKDFAKIPGFTGNREDAIIYEIHVRDFTSDDSLGGKLKNTQGSYNAFIEKLDYIKELGVTHVQLLPVMNSYYGDESDKSLNQEYSTRNNNYNWGYDPFSYFTPEGMYASDSRDPYVRVNELKMMIEEIHKRDMGVVLDVVYTHMAKAEILNDIVPNYYFFMNKEGKYIGGFGNNLATTQKMAKRLMIDSLLYWVNEYKVDGFRFDMMGDADSASIQEAYDAIKKVNKNALLVGEGWVTFGAYNYGVVGADQKWADKSSAVAMFADSFRNILKSGFGSEGAPRFLTNGKVNIKELFSDIIAQPNNFTADEPGDVLQYIEAHDNLTLHDIIAYSMKYSTENEEDIQERIRLGNTILFTSQGGTFLHAGQEYGRTKEWKDNKKEPEHKTHIESFGKFVHDSYDSSDKINAFDWDFQNDKDKSDTYEYTKGLIKLRKEFQEFSLPTKEEIEKKVTLLDSPSITSSDLAIAYQISSDKRDIFVVVNADKNRRTIDVLSDVSSGRIVADSKSVDLKGLTTDRVRISTKYVELEPLTATIIVREKK